MKIDLHLHTAASDGTDTPKELVALAGRWGECVIAITDHDTIDGLPEAEESLVSNVRLIRGIEFSCAVRGEGGFRCHILGYGMDISHPAIISAIEEGRNQRLLKKQKRLEYLSGNYGIVFTKEELATLDGFDSVGKLHIGNLLVARGLCDTVGDAIEKYLSGYSLPDDRIDAEFAINAIKEAGGVAVWAHPLGGEREKRIDRIEVERRLGVLCPMGLCGLECFYSRYTEREARMLTGVAKEFSVYVSGGSDYHGKNKTVDFGSLSSDGYTPSEDEITVLSRLGIEA